MGWKQLYEGNPFFEQYEICGEEPHLVRKKAHVVKGKGGITYTRRPKILKLKCPHNHRYEYYTFKNGKDRFFLQARKVVSDHFPNKRTVSVELSRQEIVRTHAALRQMKKDISYQWHPSLDSVVNKLFESIKG